MYNPTNDNSWARPWLKPYCIVQAKRYVFLYYIMVKSFGENQWSKFLFSDTFFTIFELNM